jgi:hypothetical protein
LFLILDEIRYGSSFPNVFSITPTRDVCHRAPSPRRRGLTCGFLRPALAELSQGNSGNVSIPAPASRNTRDHRSK